MRQIKFVCTIYMRLFSVPVICICYIVHTYYILSTVVLRIGSEKKNVPGWLRKMLLQVQWNINNTVLQWFTVTSYTVHCKKHGKYLKGVHFFHMSKFPL